MLESTEETRSIASAVLREVWKAQGKADAHAGPGYHSMDVCSLCHVQYNHSDVVREQPAAATCPYCERRVPQVRVTWQWSR
jgi:hypothetical protein